MKTVTFKLSYEWMWGQRDGGDWIDNHEISVVTSLAAKFNCTSIKNPDDEDIAYRLTCSEDDFLLLTLTCPEAVLLRCRN